ncbi:MAG: hypothetical protein NTY53_17060 [Kiritimatiellaeota bacterium]|nr:hypothetical protein [Kiritimatiellota bacterium]
MNKFAVMLVACVLTASTTPALALEPFWTPLQLSAWPPVQIPNDSCTVYGLSLGLFRVGIHAKVAHEVLGEDGEDVVGFQISGYDAYSRELYGAQFAGFFSSNSKSIVGLQASGLGNFADNMPFGGQLAGLANYLKHDLGCGFQLAGFCNECQAEVGVQAALGWNHCESGVGLQLAIANSAKNDFMGVQCGLFNWGAEKSGRVEATHEFKEGHILSYGRPSNVHQGVDDMRGVQFGLVSKASDLYGIQCGLVWNDAQDARGIQLGGLNTAAIMTGLQIGFLNLHPKSMTGVQLGLFNTAESMTGVQLGFFNRAESMTGIQIGLLNVIKENSVRLLPLINAHF